MFEHVVFDRDEDTNVLFLGKCLANPVYILINLFFFLGNDSLLRLIRVFRCLTLILVVLIKK